MASPVDICNAALGHLGARAQVSAINPPDGSVEAGYCARYYPLARREVIEVANWSFAKTRVALAEEVTNNSEVWGYAYTLPADCIKPLRVLSAGATSERDSSLFDVESGVVFTDEPEAVLVYKRDVTDTARYTPLMTSAVSMVLAGYLAGPIIKGLEGAKVGAQWREQGFLQAARAAASDANGGREDSEFTPAQLGARG